MLKLDDQLCFALYAASNAVMRAYRPLLAPIHLTYPQYLVMIALWQNGAAPVNELATRLKVGANAITPLVDQLEKSGYVYRARSSADRRIVTVVLTSTGIQLEEAATEAQRQVSCRTGMTETGLNLLRGQLHALIDRITAGSTPIDGLGS